jgi:hypothetical protein
MAIAKRLTEMMQRHALDVQRRYGEGRRVRVEEMHPFGIAAREPEEEGATRFAGVAALPFAQDKTIRGRVSSVLRLIGAHAPWQNPARRR